MQIGAIASNFVLFALILLLDMDIISSLSFSDAIFQWIYVYLPLILMVFNVASLVVLSYGIARWQGARDVGFTVLPILVSGIVVYLLFIAFPDNLSFLEPATARSSFWYFYPTAVFFAACVLLLRPACWKQHRVVTLLLGLGAGLFVFQVPGWFFTLGSVVYSVFLLPWVLFLLSFLILIQTERVRQKAQEQQPALAQ